MQAPILGSPVIELATYADIDVYECYNKGNEWQVVMRRTCNDWINITQVFKKVSFSKNKRTKLLMKEGRSLKHEKVQGGYGRFQGTWVSLEDAKKLVSKYSIRDDVVDCILQFQLDPDNPPSRRIKNSVLKRLSFDEEIISPSSYKKTRRFMSLSWRSGNRRKPLMPIPIIYQNTSLPDPKLPLITFERNISSDQTMQSLNSQLLKVSVKDRRHNLWSNSPRDAESVDRFLQTPSKSVAKTSNTTHCLQLETPLLVNYKIDSAEQYKDMVLQFLTMDPKYIQSIELPQEFYHPPSNFDVNCEIDESGNTLLHWVASLGLVSLIQLLISFNADVLKSNTNGHNCFTKLIHYSTCCRIGSFIEVLQLLKVCLISPDSNGRLPLHYLVEMHSAEYSQSVSYYLDNVLSVLEKEDSKLLHFCLNYQDTLGNTVLHLAATNGEVELYQKLQSLGCYTIIINLKGQTPDTILMQSYMNHTFASEFDDGSPTEQIAMFCDSMMSNSLLATEPTTQVFSESNQSTETEINDSNVSSPFFSENVEVINPSPFILQPPSVFPKSNKKKVQQSLSELAQLGSSLVIKVASSTHSSIELQNMECLIEQMTMETQRIQTQIAKQFQKIHYHTPITTLEELLTAQKSLEEELSVSKALLIAQIEREQATVLQQHIKKQTHQSKHTHNHKNSMTELNSLQNERKLIIEEIVDWQAMSQATSKFFKYKRLVGCVEKDCNEYLDNLIAELTN